ncbi:murein hydrolase activator EnvC [Pseudooceanicola sp. HF7]|uniref:murein hydrolase activator EnvC family protein n=1 Tax=Pseudooceanicola sp. HF7 TaxID=2721560 RepID=UPI001430EE06|nr:peptidase M23 [Pseudooceanicola sp. HF7]NIZ11619.1 peptidase M23 [Pseudooceanicola sp. HF7]
MIRLALVLAMLSAPALAQEGPAARARAAAEALEAAQGELESAQGARDRVAALTDTVRAYERGLEAMREGLRDAARREAALQDELAARSGEIAALVSTLQVISEDPAPVLLLHPAGPLGTVRAGMIISDTAPALTARAEALKADLNEARALREVREGAEARLSEGLRGVQAARTALSQAVSDRRDLPVRFIADPLKVQLLSATTDTLRDFAAGLPDIVDDASVTGTTPPVASFDKGHIPLPAPGRLLRRAGEADAAGIIRPGIILETPAQALVTTPVPATIRYLGPLLDYGNVIILEPRSGLLFVLAGLKVVYGEIGEVLAAGAPLGLMGGQAHTAETPASDASGEEGGPGRGETLYIEVRQDNLPEDPAGWFEMTKETQ